MTRLLHISDTHGTFPALRGNFNLVVHSGDFFPDFEGRPLRSQEYQYDWLVSKIVVMQQWLKGRPFLFTLGNHDFLQPDMMATLLNAEGIKAFNLHDNIVNCENINFYGFPYVPAINGSYSYETLEPDMVKRVDEMVEKINKTYTDVIVAHAPIYGCLDIPFKQNNAHSIGISAMGHALDYKIDKDMMPIAYLSGHIHEPGVMVRNGMLVSNAATSQHVLEI